MEGVGSVLAPRLIAEIGDIRRFHSGKAPIAFAGIDFYEKSTKMLYGVSWAVVTTEASIQIINTYPTLPEWFL